MLPCRVDCLSRRLAPPGLSGLMVASRRTSSMTSQRCLPRRWHPQSSMRRQLCPLLCQLGKHAPTQLPRRLRPSTAWNWLRTAKRRPRQLRRFSRQAPGLDDALVTRQMCRWTTMTSRARRGGVGRVLVRCGALFVMTNMDGKRVCVWVVFTASRVLVTTHAVDDHRHPHLHQHLLSVQHQHLQVRLWRSQTLTCPWS